MKKLILAITVLALSLSANAQKVDIKPTIQKGLTASYETEMQVTTTAPQAGSHEANTKYTVNYSVENVNSDSAIITMRISDVVVPKEADAEGSEIISALKDMDVKFSTSPSGKLYNILNYNDVRQKVVAMMREMVDKQFESNPTLAQATTKDALYSVVEKQINPEYLKEQIKQNDVFSLFGRTITTGETEQSEQKGIKLSTTYTVGNVFGIITVAGSTKSVMTKEDIKNAFFTQLEESGLAKEQVEQAKSQWGMIEASGMAKMEIAGTDTYHFGANLWPTDITSSSESTIFGASVNTSTKTKLISHSW